MAQLSGVVQTVDAKAEVLALTGVTGEEIFCSSIDMVGRYFVASPACFP